MYAPSTSWSPARPSRSIRCRAMRTPSSSDNPRQADEYRQQSLQMAQAVR